jgi:hypothetical protein
MTLVQLPPPRLALRLPAVRAALGVLVLGPVFVGWLGETADAPVRLRVVGLAVVVVASYAWDDRVHSLTAASPVGVPAVRRGRALVVTVLLCLAFGLGALAVPSGVHVPVRALVLQTCALSLLLLAVIGAAGRYGDPVLALPVPVLLVVLALLYRLPARVSVLRNDPGSPGWPAERARWVVLLVVSAAVTAWWWRDPAARRFSLRHKGSRYDEGRPLEVSDRPPAVPEVL